MNNKIHPKQSNAICWYCARAAGGFGCPWADKLKPVKGWEAEIIETPTGQKLRVVKCPIFVKDKKIKSKDKPYRKEGLNDLAEAVITAACNDYRDALALNNESEIASCERFFRSNYFTALCSLDPEMLIEKLRRTQKPKHTYRGKSRND